MSIADDLKASIEKNLPAEVSTVLQARLALADKLEPECRRLTTEVESLRKQVAGHSELDQRQRDHAAYVKKNEDTQRARELEYAISKEKSATAELRRQDAMGFIDKLLANRIVRTEIQKQIPVMTADSLQYSGNNEQVPVSQGEYLQNTTETTIVEEA